MNRTVLNKKIIMSHLAKIVRLSFIYIKLVVTSIRQIKIKTTYIYSLLRFSIQNLI